MHIPRKRSCVHDRFPIEAIDAAAESEEDLGRATSSGMSARARRRPLFAAGKCDKQKVRSVGEPSYEEHKHFPILLLNIGHGALARTHWH